MELNYQRRSDAPLGRFAAVIESREDVDLPVSWPQFTVTDLNFFYGDVQALVDLNITIPARQVTAFIGPSGCGKTTFLRTLNRMYEAIPGTRLTGTILLDSTNVVNLHGPDLRRRVGMVFQKPNPFPKSIFDNVAYGLRVNSDVPRSVVRNRVEKSLRRAALWDEVKDRLDRSAYSLSGGQQQRLCIARALAVEPEVLLLDEPCSALDPIATAQIEDLILNLRTECTMVVVTHNMMQAARIAHHVGFFLHGRLVEFDKAKVMFQNPSNTQTEDYVTGRFG